MHTCTVENIDLVHAHFGAGSFVSIRTIPTLIEMHIGRVIITRYDKTDCCVRNLFRIVKAFTNTYQLLWPSG